MMIKRVRYILLFILPVIMACSHQKSDYSPHKKEVRAILMQQQKFWNQGNIKGFMKGYLKSDSLRFASGGNVTYGWQTTLDKYLKSYPDKKTMGRLLFSNIDIKMLSDKTALVFGSWELTRETDHPHGLFTLIFNKTGCGWRIIHDHTSLARE